MTESNGTDIEGGYFDLGERPRSKSPSMSIRSSDSLSIRLPSPTTTMASLTALQYLPVPLLVLTSLKTVVIANEAMGRLLGIDFESTTLHDSSISDVLQEKSMGDLGIDILQNGSPILVSWEVRNGHGLESERELWIDRPTGLSGQCHSRFTCQQRAR
jgi:hypothetical protein